MRILRHRNGVIFLGVSAVWGFSATAMSVTAGVWVMALTGSGSLAALAGLCVYLPTLAGPVLGTLVDRLPRRAVLVWTCLLTAVALLPLLWVRGPGHVWLIYAVMFGYGVSHVLVDAADAAVLPAALPSELLGEVNGLRTSAQEGTKLIAPLAGAALFTWSGGPPVVAMSAAALAGSAALYALVRTTTKARPLGAARDSVLRRSAEGARYLWRHRTLRLLVGGASVTVSLSGVGTAAFYVMVVDGLGRPAAFAGVLAAVQGAGSVVGGTLAGRIMRRSGAAVLGGAGALLYAAGPALQAASWTPAAVTGSLLIGLGLPWTVVAAMTTVQTATPDALLGRVAATSTTAVFAPVAVALAVGAGLVAVVDHRIVLGLTATGAAATGLRLLTARTAPT